MRRTECMFICCRRNKRINGNNGKWPNILFNANVQHACIAYVWWNKHLMTLIALLFRWNLWAMRCCIPLFLFAQNTWIAVVVCVAITTGNLYVSYKTITRNVLYWPTNNKQIVTFCVCNTQQQQNIIRISISNHFGDFICFFCFIRNNVESKKNYARYENENENTLNGVIGIETSIIFFIFSVYFWICWLEENMIIDGDSKPQTATLRATETERHKPNDRNIQIRQIRHFALFLIE